MAALDESMGFGFGAIGGAAEQSINLGAIDWSPPPKRSHSARQMPPPRARQMPPSIVVDISPADARAAELVRQANCAVATKIKSSPGRPNHWPRSTASLEKGGATSTACFSAGRRAYAAFPEIRVRVAGALVRPYRNYRALARLIAGIAIREESDTPRRSPRPRKVTASGPSDRPPTRRTMMTTRRCGGSEAALAAHTKHKNKRRRDGGSRSSSSLEMPRRSPRKHAGSTVPAPAPAPRLAMLAAASPPPRRSPRRQAAVEAALLGSDSSDGEEEVVESGAVASPPARKRQKNAENVSPASREEADLLRAALESPAGGALFAWNGGGPQSFQTPPSKDHVLPRRRRGGERAAPPPARRAVAAAARRCEPQSIWRLADLSVVYRRGARQFLLRSRKMNVARPDNWRLQWTCDVLARAGSTLLTSATDKEIATARADARRRPRERPQTPHADGVLRRSGNIGCLSRMAFRRRTTALDPRHNPGSRTLAANGAPIDVLLHGREDDVLRLRRSPHVAEGQAVLLDRNQSDLRFRVERRQRERVGRLLEGALDEFFVGPEVLGDAREAPPVELDGSFSELSIRESSGAACCRACGATLTAARPLVASARSSSSA